MIGRRVLFGAAAALAGGRAVLAQSPAGVTHSLLVGIDAYRVRPLRGCLNDLALLERAMQPLATTTTVLRDTQATRAGFDAAWEAVAARCNGGDRLLLAFSGHGNRAARRGTVGEWDNFLVFQGYDPLTAPRDIMRDSEIEQRFAALGRRGVSVVFIADCCHSGLLTRGVDPSAAVQRTTRTNASAYPPAVVAQSLAAGPPPPPSPRPAELEHVHFFAGCLPSQEVPEVQWKGKAHGALSIAIAEGLRGAADSDGDGLITAREMSAYVIQVVRGLADTRQTPEMKLGTRAPPVLRQIGQATPAPPPAPAPAPDPLLRLRIEGGAPAGMPALDGVQISRDGPFDLLWRPAAGQTVSALGDVIAAEGVTPALLAASIARLRALARLQAMVAQHAMEIRLERVGGGEDAGAAVHVEREVLRLVSDGVPEANLVMVNIAGDGTVQLLYPDPDNRKEVPLTPPGQRLVIKRINVQKPFGTDRPVVVTSNRSLEPLAEALRRLHGRLEPMAAVDAVAQAVNGSRWQMGLGGIFTKSR